MTDWKDDIEKYKRGELSPREMHELEKRALYDPFLADALEGVETISNEELSNDIAELNQKINRKKQVIFTPIRIAAGIVILISVSLYLFWPADVPPQMAEETQDSVPKTEQRELTLAQEPERQEPKKEEQKKVTGARSTEKTTTTIDSTVVKENISDQTQLAPATAHTETVTTPASKTISGTVTVAEDGLPLPGVTIKVKGTTLGTTTDLNGHYSLNVPDSTSLVFSFVGRQTSELNVHDKAKLDVKLNEDVAQLSEVVITRSALPRPESLEPMVILAEPVGGIKAYDKYMENNLRYPQQALENNVKGRVVVEFKVDIDGSLNNFVVMRSLGFGCDDEVIRLVKEGPTWRPTTEDNKPVESTVRVRMKFDPNKSKKKR